MPWYSHIEVFMKLTPFQNAYLVAALWSTNDGSNESGGEPIDANYSIDDIASECITQAISDCDAFQYKNAVLLAQAGDDEQNGHDFWLTRNRHGTGFWDRGYSKEVGDALTDTAHAMGEIDLYIGDDGVIYGA